MTTAEAIQNYTREVNKMTNGYAYLQRKNLWLRVGVVVLASLFLIAAGAAVYLANSPASAKVAAQAAPPSGDVARAFLARLSEAGQTVEPGQENAALAAGYAVCAQLQSGATPAPSVIARTAQSTLC